MGPSKHKHLKVGCVSTTLGQNTMWQEDIYYILEIEQERIVLLKMLAYAHADMLFL